MEAITTDEKIDYIYKTLRRNHRWSVVWAIFKWGFRLAILGYLYYFFIVGLPMILDKIVPSLSNIPGLNVAEQFKSITGETGEVDMSWSEQIKELLNNSPQVKELLESYLK